MVLLLTSNVYADEIVVADEIGTRPTNWTDVLEIPQFDPSRGTLSEIELQLTSTVEGDAAFENLGPSSTVVTMVHSADVVVLLPTTNFMNVIPTDLYTTTLPAFDTELDWDGLSGQTLKMMATRAITQVLVADADIAPFIGTGMLTIPISATGGTESLGPGNFAVLLNTNASSSALTLKYIFDTPNVTIETYTNSFDADDANDPDVPEIDIGDPVTWTYVVENTGSVPFAQDELFVTDSVSGVTPIFIPSSDDGDLILTPGETWLFEFVTTAIDLPTAPSGTPIVPGCDPGTTSHTVPTYENIGFVTVPRYNLEDSDPTHHCNQVERDLILRKLIDEIDVESNSAANVPSYQPGDPITWTYVLTNVGAGPYELHEISLTDSDPAVNPVFDPTSDAGNDEILSSGETWHYMATGTAQNLDRPEPGTTIVSGCGPDPLDADRPVYRNIAAVVADDVAHSDDSYYCQARNSSLAIEKRTNGVDADDANDSNIPQLAPGDPITWTYEVENTGTVAVVQSDVQVTDSQQGVTPQFVSASDQGNDGILSPGEIWLFQAESVAQYLHIPNPQITTVDGCNPADTELPRPAYENIGTVLLNSVATSDPSHYCNPPIPQVAVEKLTNDVDADDPNMPGVPEVAPGDPVTWVYYVKNNGNVHFAQSNVQLVDSDSGVIPVLDPASDVLSDQVLSVGETWRYTATGVAADLSALLAGIQAVVGCDPTNLGLSKLAYMNTATVTVPGAIATDLSHYCNPPQPAIEIEKMTNAIDADDPDNLFVPLLAVGDAITWTYVVHNSGNVAFTLAEISVTDSDPAIAPVWVEESDIGADKLLAPGESWLYLAFGTAQDLQNPQTGITVVDGCDRFATGIRTPAYQNIATVEAGDVTDIDPSHYCLSTERHLALKKFTNGTDVANVNDPSAPRLSPGDKVEWLYLVTNTGTEAIPLSEVSVMDSDPAVLPVFDPGSDINGDAILSPGEEWTYRAMGRAVNLSVPDKTITPLQGCTENGALEPRETYQNVAVVQAGTAADSDTSYYCTLKEGLEFKKRTNGADAADRNGTDVPELKPGATVTWTYVLTNTGEISYTLSEIDIRDSDSNVLPTLTPESDTSMDQLLSPSEIWIFQAVGQVRMLEMTDSAVTVVEGCANRADLPSRPTYENTGAVRIGNASLLDKSHYCNPILPDFVVQKLTNGSDADDANGGDVPLITPSTFGPRTSASDVKWTYIITNTGIVDIRQQDITIIESDSTLTPTLDISTDANGDRILSVGESWTYVAEAASIDLRLRSNDERVVSGCVGVTSNLGFAYRNVVTVAVDSVSRSDPSHYCNLIPTNINTQLEPESALEVTRFSEIFIPIFAQFNTPSQ